MSKTVSLYVMGISVSQLKSGAFALILAEENGPRRIPLIIGEAEAKSIALVMEGIQTPRPLTHDLFVTFAHAFGIRMQRVFIYKFDDGIFYSHITFSDGNGREVTVDSRTSDAIAIALRTGSPIETTEEIMSTAGFILSTEPDVPAAGSNPAETEPQENRHASYHNDPKVENYSVEQLENTLAELIEREEYEEAERISRLLEQKRRKQ